MSEGVDAGAPLMLPAKVAGGEALKPQPGPAEAVPVRVKHSEAGPNPQGTAQEVIERKGSYYQKLNVSEGAKPEEIKIAYFNAMRLVHPDVNPDPAAVETAKELSEAYAVLSSVEKRKRYDQFDMQKAKAEAARAATGFTPSETMNPADVGEAMRWADGVMGALDADQVEEIKRRGMEAAAVAQEKGLSKPDQINFIMGNTITRNFLNMAPNENVESILRSAAEKNLENPAALLALILILSALLLEGVVDLVSENTDNALEKLAMAMSVGGMAAVYEFIEISQRAKKTTSKPEEVKTDERVELQDAALATSTSTEQPAPREAVDSSQLATVTETPKVQDVKLSIGATLFTPAVMANMNQS